MTNLGNVVRLQLKDVDYGYGFVPFKRRQYLIFQFPFRCSHKSSFGEMLDEIFLKTSNIVKELLRDSNDYETQRNFDDRRFLIRRSRDMARTIEAKSLRTVIPLYESFKDVGRTKDVTVPELNTSNGSMIFGNVGYIMLKIPPMPKSCKYSVYRKWNRFYVKYFAVITLLKTILHSDLYRYRLKFLLNDIK